jgi:hypothetical protein
MKEKIISSVPGVFMGLSTTKAYKGKMLTFYDGTKRIMEVDLTTAFPTDTDLLPGIEEYIFFKHSLRMKYPEEAEKDIEVFVSEN